MLSKVGSRKKLGEDSGNGKLLNEIEAISKALSLDKGSQRAAHDRSTYVGKTHVPEPKPKLQDAIKDSFEQEKKSLWSWKGLKALTHVRPRKFNCCFSLQVHSIEGLPPQFDDLSLVVHWKRGDGDLMTNPARVFQGIAEFEEQLTHTCLVYGSRNGPHNSAKYEAKRFLLYASVYDGPELDLGKHRVDLTRLLPPMLEELEDEKSSGKWKTSFRLSGKAAGASMTVSFGYLVIGNNIIVPGGNKDVPKILNFRQNGASTVMPVGEFNRYDDESKIQRTGSLPITSSSSHISLEDIKDLHEVLPASKSELSDAVNRRYQKLDENNLNDPVDYTREPDLSSEAPERLKLNSYLSVSGKENTENECDLCEFSVIEQGIEFSSKVQVKPEEKDIAGSIREEPDIAEINGILEMDFEEGTELHHVLEEIDHCWDELLVGDCNSKKNNICTKESHMKEPESALNTVSDLTKEGLDYQEDDSEISNHKNNLEDKMVRKGRSQSLDDFADSVATEFLDMLGIEHSPFYLSSESEPESPRQKLLRQFEKDSLAQGCSLFNFDNGGNQMEFDSDAPTECGWDEFSQDYDHSSRMLVPEDMPKISTEAVRIKTRASMLEDLETEALMREWGLNEEAFQCSPPNGSSRYGVPVNLSHEPQLPPLGEGLGPFVQTKNGGFLRSMNPALFRNAKNKANLIMQVSSPVVLPAQMGSGIMEILRQLASVGIEKLSMQASKLMPLEDIAGKSMQEIAMDVSPTLEGVCRKGSLQHEWDVGQNAFSGQEYSRRKSFGSSSSKLESISVGNYINLEFVPLEDLAPVAMDKIEALSIEGLRIQSGMMDEDAPSNISPQCFGEFSALEGKQGNICGFLGLEGAVGLQLVDIKDNADKVDGLLRLSLTLDEWMRLDSGEIDDEDQISERTSKILAAHHATCTYLSCGGWTGRSKRGRGFSGRCGLLGNNFTVAFTVQLHDPLRNYEPVGTLMLALIQVERIFVPLKPKIYSMVSEARNADEQDESPSSRKEDTKEETKEENILEEKCIPWFKITEVHVASLKTDPQKKLWGSTTQQQSSSRWLLANGMGKKNKHPLMKSKAVARSSFLGTTIVQPSDTLWSISACFHGTGTRWKASATLNPCIRNPNIIFPTETIRLY